MFYREAGQFKTTYAADMAIFPIRQDRDRPRADPRSSPSSSSRCSADQFLLNTMMIPFLILSLAAIGLNLLTGYTGPPFARHRRLHGGRRLRLLQARDLFPAGEHPRLDHRERLRLGARRRRCSACRACASRASISRWRRWPRSSFSNGASPACPGSYNYNDSGAIEVPTADPVRRPGHRPDRDAGRRAISSS